MEQRRVGSSGLQVSALGLGCNNFGGRMDAAAAARVVHAALDLGVTHFDTADTYPMGVGRASEEILGRALKGRRQDAVVATKCGKPMDASGRMQGASRLYLCAAVEASLRRLDTEHIDLLYVHQPDPDTPVGETLAALDDLIRAGKVRYVAASNCAAWQIVEAEWTARAAGLNRYIATQEQYSLIARGVERELLPVCKRYGLGLVPYFPLASGILTGKYCSGQAAPEGTRLATAKGLAELFLTEANLALAERLGAFAAERGRTLLDLAFAWLLRDPVVPSVIAGASTPEQLQANAKACTWTLSAADAAEVGARLGG
ncbi:MAG: aldo/keto reductase [Deferrisomatales bacterium]|nr:aldo/keto reductase [Deferrisomatales bacterium]